MKDDNLTFTFQVDQSPEEAFAAINNVRGWWTENLEGDTRKQGDEFEVRFDDVHYSKQKLVEVVPNKKVVWLVTDSKLTFIDEQAEWTNTRIVYEISVSRDKTQVRFTHEGLVPGVECYDACSNAWGDYITGSLRKLIAEGKGKPG